MSTVDSYLVTTAFDLPGYRTVRNLGVVRGIVVRSRSIVGNIGAVLQTLVGGNITLYTELCESARADAFGLMLDHAADLGANALIGVRARRGQRPRFCWRSGTAGLSWRIHQFPR